MHSAAVDEGVPVAARVVRLGAGLATVEIVDAPSSPDENRNFSLWLGQLPTNSGDGIDVLAAAGGGDQWLRRDDKLVVVRATSAGAMLLASAFGSPGQAPAAPNIVVRPLGPWLAPVEPVVAVPSRQPLSRSQRDVRAEVTVHLEGLGDRVFAGASWAGEPGGRKRVEAFSIKPLHELRPSEIEYKVLHPGGVETPWVGGPEFCGTKGRSLPIVGFAVRIASHVQDQFSVVYQAAFFRGGITEARSNGAPCLPKFPGDALEAINIRILQSQPG